MANQVELLRGSRSEVNRKCCSKGPIRRSGMLLIRVMVINQVYQLLLVLLVLTLMKNSLVSQVITVARLAH